jgi:hypothetical protein
MLTTLAMGELKLRRIDRFLKTFGAAQRKVSRWKSDDTDRHPDQSTLLTPGLSDRYLSLTSYFYLHAPHQTKPEPELSIAQAVNAFEGSRPYLSHDRAILARYPDQGATMTAEHLPLDQCAAVCLPFTPTSFYKSVEGIVQTDRYK